MKASQDAQSAYDRGIKAFEADDFKAALTAFGRAAELDPEFVLAYVGQGDAHGNLGKFEAALEAFDYAISIDVDCFSALQGKGRACYHLGEYENALTAYYRATVIDPESASIHCDQGTTLSSLGRKNESIAAFDVALQLDPKNTNVHNGRGNTLRDMKRYDEALASYDRAIECKPDSAIAHSNRGNVLSDLGQFREAILAYDRAIEISPEYANAFCGRGSALGSLGLPAESLESHHRAIALDPDKVHFHTRLGDSLWTLGLFEDALPPYECALELDPEKSIAHRGRGNIFRDLCRIDEALTAYDRSLSLDPDDTAAHNGRGNALWDAGRLGEALEAYDRSLELEPENNLAHNGRGNVLRDLSRTNEAIEAYDRSLTLNPADTTAHNGRGNALWDAGRLDEALQAYDRSLELERGNNLAHNGRANALRDLGRFDEALTAYDRSLAISPGDADAHNGRGNVLTDLQQFERALEAYNQACEAAPRQPLPWLNKARLLLLQQQPNDDIYELKSSVYDPVVAQQAFLRAIHLMGRLTDPHLGLRRWMLTTSVRLLKETFSLPLVYNRLVHPLSAPELLFDTDPSLSKILDQIQAVSLLEESLEGQLRPRDPTMRKLTLGMIKFYWGDVFTAEVIFKELLAEGSNPPAAHWFIKRCLASYAEEIPQETEAAALASAHASLSAQTGGATSFFAGIILEDSEAACEAAACFELKPSFHPSRYKLWAMLREKGDETGAEELAESILMEEERRLKEGESGYLAFGSTLPDITADDFEPKQTSSSAGARKPGWLMTFEHFVYADEIHWELNSFHQWAAESLKFSARYRSLSTAETPDLGTKFDYRQRLSHWRLREEARAALRARQQKLLDAGEAAELRERLRGFLSEHGLLETSEPFAQAIGLAMFNHAIRRVADNAATGHFRDAVLLMLVEGIISIDDATDLWFYLPYLAASLRGVPFNRTDLLTSTAEVSLGTLLTVLDLSAGTYVFGAFFVQVAGKVTSRMADTSHAEKTVLRFTEFRERFARSLYEAGFVTPLGE